MKIILLLSNLQSDETSDDGDDENSGDVRKAELGDTALAAAAGASSCNDNDNNVYFVSVHCFNSFDSI